MEWYLKALRQYVDFKGRARRKEYWMFFLINTLIGLGLALVEMILNTDAFSNMYSLAVLVPCLAAQTRRLHDIGRYKFKKSLYLFLF